MKHARKDVHRERQIENEKKRINIAYIWGDTERECPVISSSNTCASQRPRLNIIYGMRNKFISSTVERVSA